MLKKVIFIFLIVLFIQQSLSSFAVSCEEVFSSTEFTAVLPAVEASNKRGGVRESERLKKQGYAPYLYSGIDEVIHLTRVGKSLKSEPVHPDKTHIEDFALAIDPAVAHIRKGIEMYKHHRKAYLSKMRILSRFINEARLRRQERQVTYRWWLLFSLRLSILGMPYSKKTKAIALRNEWQTHKGMEGLLESEQAHFSQLLAIMNRFPEMIIIPTTAGLGLMALNRASAQGVAPIELANHKKNGQYAYDYFMHDINHAQLGYGVNYGSWHAGFHKGFLRAVEDLPAKDRLIVEMVYFWRGHEHPKMQSVRDFLLTGIRSAKKKKAMFQELSSLFFHVNADFLYDNGLYYPSQHKLYHVRKMQFVKDSIELFSRTAREVIKQENLGSQ